MTLRGFKNSAEELTADVVELARELELKVEPEDMTSLLQSHNKTWMDEELILMDKQREWFLKMESILVKMLWSLLKWQQRIKIVNLVDKATEGFEKTFNFERNFTEGKTVSYIIACNRQIVHERMSQLIWQTYLLAYFKKLLPPPWSVSSYRHWGKDAPPGKRLWLPVSDDG